MRAELGAAAAGTGAGGASRRLHGAHERFASSREVAAQVRPVVAESWRRCAESGVCLDGSRLPALRVGAEELDEHRQRHPLAPLLPMFQDMLGESAVDDGHLFAVGDGNGTLLWVRGQPATLRRAERMNFVEGAGWTEAQAGTNAPGTALAIGRPVQVVGVEHYNAAVQRWSCAAAPVRDPDGGQVLGVLDLTGGDSIATPQALALVRACAWAAEAELARQVAVADERARMECARLLTDTLPAALVSPGGRVLHATPGLTQDGLLGLAAATALGMLPDGRRVLVEPVGVSGHVVVHFVDGGQPQADGSPLWLTALGRDTALLQVDGRVRRLRPRHSEILVVLALAGGGLSGGRLAVDLSEHERARVTLRAEMSRLRAVLGPDLLDSMPYRLRREVRGDFLTVRELLADGRVGEAVALYSGPLLPSSDAPVVVAARVALEQQVRSGVLASGDPGLVRRWVDAPWGADDAPAWRRLADLLPGGSAQRAAAATRARALQADLAVARPARSLPAAATLRQPHRG